MRKAIDFIKEGNEGFDFRTLIYNLDEDDIINCMTEFAKMHVKNALDSACKMAELSNQRMFACGEDYIPIDKDLVLNAYSLDSII